MKDEDKVPRSGRALTLGLLLATLTWFAVMALVFPG